MIYVFGTRQSHLRTVPTPGHACPACADSESLKLLFFSRYFFISLLPIVPLERETVLVCANCQQKGPERVIPVSLQPLARQLKQQSKRPWWQFSGVLLLLAVPLSEMVPTVLSRVAAWFPEPAAQAASFAGFRAQAKLAPWNAQQQARLLATPQVGDVYVQLPNTVDAAYMMRVQRVSNDTVYVSMCKQAEKGNLAYQRFRDTSYFRPAAYPLAVSALQAMYTQKHFSDVLRPE